MIMVKIIRTIQLMCAYFVINDVNIKKKITFHFLYANVLQLKIRKRWLVKLSLFEALQDASDTIQNMQTNV